MSQLRIGIDGEALRKPMSGVGNYVYGLCCELDKLMPHAQFYVYSRFPAEALSLPSARWLVRHEVQPLLRKIPSFLWLKTRGAELCKEDKLTHFWAGRTIHPRLPKPVKTLVTVHDLNHLVVPETMQRSTRFSHQLWFAGDVKSADVVMCNSRGTADRLAAALGVKADVVIHPGVADCYRPLLGEQRAKAAEGLAKLGVKSPYILSVGTLEPRKNVELLFDSFMALKSQGKLDGYQLVLAGARGWQNKSLEQRLKAAAPAGVTIPGYVPNELMPALFGLADLLVCASSYEGFGMPVLEARSCGTPVLTSDVPELREAAGGYGAVAPQTVDGLADAVLKALSDDKVTTLPDVALISWANGARKLIQVLNAESRKSATAVLN